MPNDDQKKPFGRILFSAAPYGGPEDSNMSCIAKYRAPGSSCFLNHREFDNDLILLVMLTYTISRRIGGLKSR